MAQRQNQDRPSRSTSREGQGNDNRTARPHQLTSQCRVCERLNPAQARSANQPSPGTQQRRQAAADELLSAAERCPQVFTELAQVFIDRTKASCFVGTIAG
jgi:hypothetical protein